MASKLLRMRYRHLLIGALFMAGFALFDGHHSAFAAQPIVVGESFSNGSIDPGKWGMLDDACLTAGAGSLGSVDGNKRCATNNDPAGRGALRLTINQNDRTGGILYKLPIPVGTGFDIQFNTYQYGGSAWKDDRFPFDQKRTADGIAFFLIDADKTDEIKTVGTYGAGLGYASQPPWTQICRHAGQTNASKCNGLKNGYVGVGLDAFGNFSHCYVGDNDVNTGCRGGETFNSGERANSLVIRGKGSFNDEYRYSSYGYRYVVGRKLPRNLALDRLDRGGAKIHVGVILDESKQLTVSLCYRTDSNNHCIPTPDNRFYHETISLKEVNEGDFPRQFKLGFAGSTGNANNVIEVSDFTLSYLASISAVAKQQPSTIVQSGQTLNSQLSINNATPTQQNEQRKDQAKGTWVQWLESSLDPDTDNKYASPSPGSNARVYGFGVGDQELDSGNFDGEYPARQQSVVANRSTARIDGKYKFVCSAIQIEQVSGYMGIEEAWLSGAVRVGYAWACTPIGKSPLVQIWGGDARVGQAFLGAQGNNNAGIVTASFGAPDGTYGSWGEYGLLASGIVRSASAGTLSGSRGYSPPPLDESRNLLTFANTNPYGRWGEAGAMSGIVEDLWKRPGVPGPGTIDVGGASGVLDVGNARVSGDIKGGGKTVIIRAKGKVTIDKDIKLDGNSISSVSDISQVIIMARDIEIRDGVKQVDAWLIARPEGGNGGVISTCNEAGPTNKYYAGLYIGGPCDANELRINGLVMARQLQLRRTKGASEASGGFSAPAEVINMRPDSYLWVVQQSTAVGRIDTLFTTELPPRF